MNEEKLGQEGWALYGKRIKSDKAIKITEYAKQYLEPILKQFPEIKDKVYLLLRKNGWFANYEPVMQIVIREEALALSEWRIRSTTAHELLHLVQFINGIGIDKSIKNGQIEKQATFLTFSRGFSYDYLKSFSVECNKDSCDHKFTYAYFCCDKIFKGCCKEYTEESILILAEKLKRLASNYNLHDNPDYNKIMHDCCIKDISSERLWNS